ncbi:MAG: hypothetical protein RLW61_06445 [Gammaproteobacteria bacterium]
MTDFPRTLTALSLAAAFTFTAPGALAASATAFAAFDGIADIRTTGTASVSFTGIEMLEAMGMIDGGIADPANDGMGFDVETTSTGSGEATNSGLFGATSLAATSSSAFASAFTFVDAEMLLEGTGNVEIDIAYSISIDEFDNLPAGFVNAGVEAFTSFDSALVELDVPGSLFGTFDSLSGVLTLAFFVDVDPLTGAFEDVLTVHTFANAQAAPVPVPAALWLLAPAVAGLAGARRTRAAA